MTEWYSYDDNAEVWPFFAATLVGVIVLPASAARAYALVRPQTAKSETTGAKHKSYNSAAQASFRAKAAVKKNMDFVGLLLALGWVILAALIYYIRQQISNQAPQQTFDPYTILGISMSATEREIKKAFRTLSVQFHPDKIRDLGEQTIEMIQQRYVDITKAYKALTDEVTRENFIKYGHPDGPQQSSHGIALPKFLVEGGSAVVLLLYAGLVLLLPVLASAWWYAQMSKNKAGVLQTTATAFFELCSKDQPMFISFDRVLDIIFESEEIKEVLGQYSRAQLQELLQAHFHRKAVDNEADKLELATRAAFLVQGFQKIADEFRFVGFSQRLITLHRCLVQAVPLECAAQGAVLQLPEIGLDSVLQGKQVQITHEMLQTAGKYLPRIHILSAKFEAPGFKVVPPKSVSHLNLKFVVLPFGYTKVPSFSPEELAEVVDPSDLRALTNPMASNQTQPAIPEVVCPYLPLAVTPAWKAYVSNQLEQKYTNVTMDLDRVDLSNLQLSKEELDKGDKIVVGSFKLQMMPSPEQPGKYAYNLILANTAYFGSDVRIRLEMMVKVPTPQDLIIEPAQDAGEGEDLEKEIAKEEEEEEEDEEDDLSDIDTDTDEE